MIRLISKIFVMFVVVTVFYFSVIYLAPYSKVFAYNYKSIRDINGGKIGWVYERIKKPVDYVFIGSSHTLGGVDDSFIQKVLRTSLNNESIYVTNLARNWSGRNLDYLFIKELLENQKPRVIFLEVTEKIPYAGNKLFPILASNEEIFVIDNLSNLELFRDIHTTFKSRFDSLFDGIFNNTSRHNYSFKEHGYLAQEGNFDGISVPVRNTFVNKYLIPGYNFLHNLSNNINAIFYHNYMTKIFELAKEKNVKVMFLYIPGYNPQKLPDEINMWKDKYIFLIPSRTIFTKIENFADKGHLNPKGTHELSTWIANKLIEDLN